MDNISDIAIGVGSVIAALIALIGVLFGIRKINSQKSFELLTQARLKTISELRLLFTELRMVIFEVAEKSDLKNNDAFAYCDKVNNVISRLQTLLTLSECQEHHLLNEVGKLKNMLFDYLELLGDLEMAKESKEENPPNMPNKKMPNMQLKNKEELLKQADIVFVFSDIYIWSIWVYIQHLYDSKEEKHHSLFDKVFKDVYRNYLHLNTEKPEFFNKYPIERLIDPNHNQTKRRGK